MIRFEVSGATAEEFAENAMKAWGVLAVGLQAAVAQLRSQTASPPATPPSSVASPPATPPSSVASPPATPPSSVVSSTVAPAVVHSDTVDDLFTSEMEPMENPKAGDTPKKSSKSTAKTPKLDDLKTRLSEVISAAAERWDVKRANAYARKLLKEFGVEKLGDLKPDQFGAFMDASGDYVAGLSLEP